MNINSNQTESFNLENNELALLIAGKRYQQAIKEIEALPPSIQEDSAFQQHMKQSFKQIIAPDFENTDSPDIYPFGEKEYPAHFLKALIIDEIVESARRKVEGLNDAGLGAAINKMHVILSHIKSRGFEILNPQDMTIAGVELKGIRLNEPGREEGLKQFLNLLETEQGVRAALEAVALEQWDEAAVILEPMLQHKPNNWEAVRMYSAYCYCKAMKIYNQSNNLDEAQRIIIQGLKYNPNNPKLKRALSNFLRLEGSATARKADEYLRLGKLFEARKLFASACDLVERALEDDPANEKIKENLTSIYYQGESLLGRDEFGADKQKAAILHQKAIEKKKTAFSMCLENEDWERALVVYRQAMELFAAVRELNPFDGTIRSDYCLMADMVDAITRTLKEESGNQKKDDYSCLNDHQ